MISLSDIKIKGYLVFSISILFPLFIFIIAAIFAVGSYWPMICFIWLGFVIIIGIYQFFGATFKSHFKSRLGGSYNFISGKGLVEKNHRTSLFNKRDNPESRLSSDASRDTKSNETTLNATVFTADALTAASLKEKEKDNRPVTGSTSVIFDTNVIFGMIKDSKEKKEKKEDNNYINQLEQIDSELNERDLEEGDRSDPMTILKSDPSNTRLIDTGDNKHDVELILTNRGHGFWLKNYSYHDILDGYFLTDMWLEYSKADMRQFNYEHWIYSLHFIQSMGSMGGGALLMITLPFEIMRKISSWFLLFFSIFQIIMTCTYFLTLLWKGSYSSGVYCLYWIPIFFLMLSNFIFFEYSIYLLHYY